MQTSHTSNQTLWKHVYQDALFESDPRLLPPKLEAARKAVEVTISREEGVRWTLGNNALIHSWNFELSES